MASAPNTRRTRHERIDLFLAPLVENCLGRLTIVAADSRSIDCSLRSLYLTRLQLNLGVSRTTSICTYTFSTQVLSADARLAPTRTRIRAGLLAISSGRGRCARSR